MRTPRNCALILLLVVRFLSATTVLWAADPPSAVGPLLGLLKKGALPAERVPNAAKLVCERGNEHDLAYIFSEVTGERWSADLKTEALGWLQEAAATRKVRPAGDLSGLATLITTADTPEMQSDAIRLAAVWKPEAAIEPLQALAADKGGAPMVRAAAIDALVDYGGSVAQHTIDQLLAADQPLATRMQGAAALAGIDLPQAAAAAANVLRSATANDDLAPLVDAFLMVKEGADQLAAALKANPPSSEVALLALRHIYAVGRSDPALDSLLSDLAGIKGEVPKLTNDQLLAKAADATRDGDAIRGEAVFRRADLACLRCHAVSKAGGQIGPDLSAVGVSSPVDYLVKSVYDPDAQKKEEFVTRILVTNEGQQLTGIVTNRTEEKLTLKLADGKLVDIAASDIDYEGVGRSLMPEGLVKFMTEQEMLDLVKFLSTLGKPGTPFEIRSTQRLQRWQVLKSVASKAIESIPDEQALGDLVLRAGSWESAYGRVNGELPLAELVQRTGQSVIYLQGEVDVTAAGVVQVQLDAADGVTLWLNGNSVDLSSPPARELPVGRHQLTFRVDAKSRGRESLSVTLVKPAGSKAQFTVVDGQ